LVAEISLLFLNVFSSVTNKIQCYVFISVKCSTCFRRVLRPSSGAQNCVHSIRYLPCFTATYRCSGRVGTTENRFQLFRYCDR
jgi:hypothetical protein